jgi:hypothetical protein
MNPIALLKVSKRSIPLLGDSEVCSLKGFKRLKLMASKNPNSHIEDKVIKPLQAYIGHLENVVMALSTREEISTTTRKPTPKASANADDTAATKMKLAVTQKSKKLAGELLVWGNDYFPITMKNTGLRWDGNRAQAEIDYGFLVFPAIPGDPLSRYDLTQLADAVKALRNIYEISIVELFRDKYLAQETEYFKEPTTIDPVTKELETHFVMKEKDLNAFFEALNTDSIKEPNDERYRAFKEALAPHLVRQHRIRNGQSIKQKNGVVKRPTRRSTRKTRMEKDLFGCPATVQAEGTKHDVAFIALVMFKELKMMKSDRRFLGGKKRDSLEGRVEQKVGGRALKQSHNKLKGKMGWETQGLATYTSFLSHFEKLWSRFHKEEDFIYPLVEKDADVDVDVDDGDLTLANESFDDDDDSPQNDASVGTEEQELMTWMAQSRTSSCNFCS